MIMNDELKLLFDKYYINNSTFVEKVDDYITESLLNKNCSSKSYMYHLCPHPEGIIYEDITISKLYNYDRDHKEVYYSDEELKTCILSAIKTFYYDTFMKDRVGFYEADMEIYQKYCDISHAEFARSIWTWNMISITITHKRFVTFRIVYVEKLPDELKSRFETIDKSSIEAIS